MKLSSALFTFSLTSYALAQGLDALAGLAILLQCLRLRSRHTGRVTAASTLRLSCFNRRSRFAQTSSNSCRCVARTLFLLRKMSLAHFSTQLASSQGSVVTSLQTYVKGVCPKEPCTASDVSTARSSIQSACAQDIARNDPIALALNAVLGDYPNTRSLLCSQEIAAGGTFCLPTTLRSIATAAGSNATLANITSIISNNNAEGFMQLVNSVPTAAYCTDVRYLPCSRSRS